MAETRLSLSCSPGWSLFWEHWFGQLGQAHHSEPISHIVPYHRGAYSSSSRQRTADSTLRGPLAPERTTSDLPNIRKPWTLEAQCGRAVSSSVHRRAMWAQGEAAAGLRRASPAQPLTQAGRVRGCWLAQGADPGETDGRSISLAQRGVPFPQSLERGRRSNVFTAEEAGVALGRDLWSECPAQ